MNETETRKLIDFVIDHTVRGECRRAGVMTTTQTRKPTQDDFEAWAGGYRECIHCGAGIQLSQGDDYEFDVSAVEHEERCVLPNCIGTCVICHGPVYEDEAYVRQNRFWLRHTGGDCAEEYRRRAS